MSEELSDRKYGYNTKYRLLGRIIDPTRPNLNDEENLANR